ncbi:MAG: DNA translocase FtsK [Anaerolineae bacterium]
MPRTKGRARSRRKAPGGPLIQLSPEAKLQVTGALLVLVAMLTLLSLLSRSRGTLTDSWLHALARGFGIGQFVVPFGLGGAGVLLLLKGIGHPVSLRWRRVTGLIVLFFVVEALAHALAFAPDPRVLAEAGHGGGYLGWALLWALTAALGDFGAHFLLFFVFGAAVLLIVDRPLAEIAAALMGLIQRVTHWYRLRRVPVVGAGLPPVQLERPREPLPERITEPLLRPRPAGNGGQGTTNAPPARPQASTAAQPARPAAGECPWRLPAVEEILEEAKEQELSEPEIRAKVRTIEETLAHFGVPARVVEVNQGPTVTQFGVEPGFVERRDAEGKMRRFKVKVNKIQSLANDLALALAATSLRIEAPVPGRPMLGIEIPNSQMTTVTLRAVMDSDAFQRLRSRLRIALGIDVQGQAIAADLATMPHLLIAGATGSGKSVCINAIIACLLCNNTPDTLRLIMVDPKRVELTGYNGIPHLLTPVVVDIDRVVGTLKWVTREMDRRYDVFARVGVRNIEGYNASAPGRGELPFPYLVVFIDELADLMMVAPDEVERSVCRIAQMARATGIHLVIATQRPSVDVVTGLIKANFPARISFAVSTQIDSRVILDAPGAEQLLGRGDMLFMPPDASKLARLQGCWVSDPEIERLVSYWKAQALQHAAALPPASAGPLVQQPLWQEVEDDERDQGDALLGEAIELVRAQNRASVSLLQRKLRVGYARAARLMDLLEERGVVGPAEGPTHSREVLPPPPDEDEEAVEAEEFEYEEDEA